MASTAFCFGCPHILANINNKEIQSAKPFNDRIQKDAGMTYEQIFILAYRDFILPQLNELSKEIGKDRFIAMLKKATDKVYSDKEFMNRLNSDVPKEFWSTVLDLEVTESTPNSYTYKISNCLWAKIFREAKASDIGYALLCYGDYAIARSNNEKLERNQTLMQGHEACILKWTKKEKT